MGLFDPSDAHLSQIPISSGSRAALPSAIADPQPLPTIARNSDALVQRILDSAANRRAPIGLFDQSTSALAPAQVSTQQQQEVLDWLGTPTVAGVLGGAGIGGNMPTIPKRPTALAPEADRTSPNAKLARSLPFAQKPLPKGWNFKTLNYRGGFPRSPNWGSALGRAAGPVGGAILLGTDLYNSDNKVRTAIADAFGILGSTIGGTAGVGGGPAGIGAGLVGGGYAGNLIGGSLYDLAAYSYAHPEIYSDPAFLATY